MSHAVIKQLQQENAVTARVWLSERDLPLVVYTFPCMLTAGRL